MNLRGLLPGNYFHIYNRGNRRENISWDNEDRGFYLETLLKLFNKFKETLVAYSFLENHYHLMVRIENVANFVAIMKSFGIRSSKYYNKKYDTVGHLFQSKYQSKIVDNEFYQIYLTKYIHLNAMKLEEVRNTCDLINYRWSSCRFFVEDIKPPTFQLKPELILSNFENKEAYRKYLLSESLSAEFEYIDLSNEKLLEKLAPLNIGQFDIRH